MIKFTNFPQIYWQNPEVAPSAPAVPPASLSGDINGVVTLCPQACDIAILVVYVDYPIKVEYNVVQEKLGVLGSGVDLENTFFQLLITKKPSRL